VIKFCNQKQEPEGKATRVNELTEKVSQVAEGYGRKEIIYCFQSMLEKALNDNKNPADKTDLADKTRLVVMIRKMPVNIRR
jgi:hypothetical protein